MFLALAPQNKDSTSLCLPPLMADRSHLLCLPRGAADFAPHNGSRAAMEMHEGDGSLASGALQRVCS